MAKFRKGDVVSLEVIVESHFQGNDVRLRLEAGYQDIYAKADQIRMVRPDIKVEDTIEWEVGGIINSGEVIGVADDHAWVKYGDGNFATVALKFASRVDLPAPEEEVA
jgi:hypothetical protein